MAKTEFEVGDVLWVDLPERTPPAHEQKGNRPVLIVGVPKKVQGLPYEVLRVVPLTRTKLSGPLFPVLSAGTGGLPLESTALVYQLTTLDSSRVRGTLGKRTQEELNPILEAIRTILASN